MPNEEAESNTIICEWCNQSTPSSLISENEFWNLSNVCITCSDNDFRYSERCDVYVALDDWDSSEHDYEDDYEDEEERDEYVFNYSRRVSSKIHRMKYEKPYANELTIGIELEVQLRDSSNLSRNDIAYSLQYEVLKDFVICKEDASIGYGF